MTNKTKLVVDQVAKNTFAYVVEHFALCCIFDLVVDTAGAGALTDDCIRAIRYVAYLSEPLDLDLYRFFVIFVIWLFDELDCHVLLEEVFAMIELCTCYCKIDLFHYCILPLYPIES